MADEWEEYLRTQSSMKKASISDKLDVISMQLNEIEQNTQGVEEIKQQLEGEQGQIDQANAMGGAPMPQGGADPMAAMMGGAPAGPVTASAKKKVIRSKSAIAKEATEKSTGFQNGPAEKAGAAMLDVIRELGNAIKEAAQNGDSDLALKLTDIQECIEALGEEEPNADKKKIKKADQLGSEQASGLSAEQKDTSALQSRLKSIKNKMTVLAWAAKARANMTSQSIIGYSPSRSIAFWKTVYTISALENAPASELDGIKLKIQEGATPSNGEIIKQGAKVGEACSKYMSEISQGVIGTDIKNDTTLQTLTDNSNALNKEFKSITSSIKHSLNDAAVAILNPARSMNDADAVFPLECFDPSVVINSAHSQVPEEQSNQLELIKKLGNTQDLSNFCKSAVDAISKFTKLALAGGRNYYLTKVMSKRTAKIQGKASIMADEYIRDLHANLDQLIENATSDPTVKKPHVAPLASFAVNLRGILDDMDRMTGEYGARTTGKHDEQAYAALRNGKLDLPNIRDFLHRAYKASSITLDRSQNNPADIDNYLVFDGFFVKSVEGLAKATIEGGDTFNGAKEVLGAIKVHNGRVINEQKASDWNHLHGVQENVDEQESASVGEEELAESNLESEGEAEDNSGKAVPLASEEEQQASFDLPQASKGDLGAIDLTGAINTSDPRYRSANDTGFRTVDPLDEQWANEWGNIIRALKYTSHKNITYGQLKRLGAQAKEELDIYKRTGLILNPQSNLYENYDGSDVLSRRLADISTLSKVAQAIELRAQDKGEVEVDPDEPVVTPEMYERFYSIVDKMGRVMWEHNYGQGLRPQSKEISEEALRERYGDAWKYFTLGGYGLALPKSDPIASERERIYKLFVHSVESVFKNKLSSAIDNMCSVADGLSVLEHEIGEIDTDSAKVVNNIRELARQGISAIVNLEPYETFDAIIASINEEVQKIPEDQSDLKTSVMDILSPTSEDEGNIISIGEVSRPNLLESAKRAQQFAEDTYTNIPHLLDGTVPEGLELGGLMGGSPVAERLSLARSRATGEKDFANNQIGVKLNGLRNTMFGSSRDPWGNRFAKVRRMFPELKGADAKHVAYRIDQLLRRLNDDLSVEGISGRHYQIDKQKFGPTFERKEGERKSVDVTPESVREAAGAMIAVLKEWDGAGLGAYYQKGLKNLVDGTIRLLKGIKTRQGMIGKDIQDYAQNLLAESRRFITLLGENAPSSKYLVRLVEPLGRISGGEIDVPSEDTYDERFAQAITIMRELQALVATAGSTGDAETDKLLEAMKGPMAIASEEMTRALGDSELKMWMDIAEGKGGLTSEYEKGKLSDFGGLVQKRLGEVDVSHLVPKSAMDVQGARVTVVKSLADKLGLDYGDLMEIFNYHVDSATGNPSYEPWSMGEILALSNMMSKADLVDSDTRGITSPEFMEQFEEQLTEILLNPPAELLSKSPALQNYQDIKKEVAGQDPGHPYMAKLTEARNECKADGYIWEYVKHKTMEEQYGYFALAASMFGMNFNRKGDEDNIDDEGNNVYGTKSLVSDLGSMMWDDFVMNKAVPEKDKAFASEVCGKFFSVAGLTPLTALVEVMGDSVPTNLSGTLATYSDEQGEIDDVLKADGYGSSTLALVGESLKKFGPTISAMWEDAKRKAGTFTEEELEGSEKPTKKILRIMKGSVHKMYKHQANEAIYAALYSGALNGNKVGERMYNMMTSDPRLREGADEFNILVRDPVKNKIADPSAVIPSLMIGTVGVKILKKKNVKWFNLGQPLLWKYGLRISDEAKNLQESLDNGARTKEALSPREAKILEAAENFDEFKRVVMNTQLNEENITSDVSRKMKLGSADKGEQVKLLTNDSEAWHLDEYKKNPEEANIAFSTEEKQEELPTFPETENPEDNYVGWGDGDTLRALIGPVDKYVQALQKKIVADKAAEDERVSMEAAGKPVDEDSPVQKNAEDLAKHIAKLEKRLTPTEISDGKAYLEYLTAQDLESMKAAVEKMSLPFVSGMAYKDMGQLGNLMGVDSYNFAQDIGVEPLQLFEAYKGKDVVNSETFRVIQDTLHNLSNTWANNMRVALTDEEEGIMDDIRDAKKAIAEDQKHFEEMGEIQNSLDLVGSETRKQNQKKIRADRNKKEGARTLYGSTQADVRTLDDGIRYEHDPSGKTFIMLGDGMLRIGNDGKVSDVYSWIDDADKQYGAHGTVTDADRDEMPSLFLHRALKYTHPVYFNEAGRLEQDDTLRATKASTRGHVSREDLDSLLYGAENFDAGTITQSPGTGAGEAKGAAENLAAGNPVDVEKPAVESEQVDEDEDEEEVI